MNHEYFLLGITFRLYRERITQIENKLQEVMAEQAAEYLGPLAELREAVAVRTQVAGILRQLRLENIKNKAVAEEVAATQDFEVIIVIFQLSSVQFLRCFTYTMCFIL
jgi:hypothetical protein